MDERKFVNYVLWLLLVFFALGSVLTGASSFAKCIDPIVSLVFFVITVLIAVILLFSEFKFDKTPTDRKEKAQKATNFAVKLLAIVFICLILVFMPGPPPCGVQCSSSDPAKINVMAIKLSDRGIAGDQKPLGTITITNFTGGTLTGISCTGSGAFATEVQGCPNSAGSGTNIELTPLPGTAGTYNGSKIKIDYTDYAGFKRNATITCTPITISQS